MKGSPYTLAFATALGSVCALVLTGAGAFTAPYRRTNARVEEMRNILGVLRVPHDPGLKSGTGGAGRKLPGLTSEGLLEVFARSVDTEDRGGLRLYLYRQEGGGPVGKRPATEDTEDTESGEPPASVLSVTSVARRAGRRGVKAAAVPFAGPGLWGPIKGFLALESDMRTIRGIAFHEQEETPGLGGEIAAASFRRRFEGKSIVDESGRPGIRILRGGGATKRNEVDGITGATTTCERVQAMLNEIIARIARARDADAR